MKNRWKYEIENQTSINNLRLNLLCPLNNSVMLSPLNLHFFFIYLHPHRNRNKNKKKAKLNFFIVNAYIQAIRKKSTKTYACFKTQFYSTII